MVKKNKHKCIACGKKINHFCNLHGRFDTSNILKKKDYIKYSFCPNCLTIQQDPVPSQKQLSKLVIKKYSDKKKKLINAVNSTNNAIYQHQKIVDVIKKYGIKEEVLDVGSGVGNLCSMLLKNKIKCNGVDLSPELVSIAQKKGLPIECKDLFKIDLWNSFSAVIMSHVFEHISDPEGSLRHVNKLLKSDGIFLTDQPTPNISHFITKVLRFNKYDKESYFKLNYINLNYFHIALYSIKGMEIIGKRCGFQLIDVIPMPSLKRKGINSLLSSVFTIVNIVGEKIFSTKWPLQVAYLFVFKKMNIKNNL